MKFREIYGIRAEATKKLLLFFGRYNSVTNSCRTSGTLVYITQLRTGLKSDSGRSGGHFAVEIPWQNGCQWGFRERTAGAYEGEEVAK